MARDNSFSCQELEAENETTETSEICLRCSKVIEHVPYRFMNQTFHAVCVACDFCGRKLLAKPFIVEGSRIFCAADCKANFRGAAAVSATVATDPSSPYSPKQRNSLGVPKKGEEEKDGDFEEGESLMEVLENIQEGTQELRTLSKKPSPLAGRKNYDPDRLTDYPRAPQQQQQQQYHLGYERYSPNHSQWSSMSESSLTSEGSSVVSFDANKQPKKKILKNPHRVRRRSTNRVRWNLPGEGGRDNFGSDTSSLQSFDSASTSTVGSDVFYQARSGVYEVKQRWREFDANSLPPRGSTGLTPAKVHPPNSSTAVGYFEFPPEIRSHSSSSLLTNSTSSSPSTSPSHYLLGGSTLGARGTAYSARSSSTSSLPAGHIDNPQKGFYRSLSPLTTNTMTSSSPGASPSKSMFQSTPKPHYQSDSILSRFPRSEARNPRTDSPNSFDIDMPILKIDHSNLTDLEESTMEDRKRMHIFRFPQDTPPDTPRPVSILPRGGGSGTGHAPLAVTLGNAFLDDDDANDYDHLSPLDAEEEEEEEGGKISPLEGNKGVRKEDGPVKEKKEDDRNSKGRENHKKDFVSHLMASSDKQRKEPLESVTYSDRDIEDALDELSGDSDDKSTSSHTSTPDVFSPTTSGTGSESMFPTPIPKIMLSTADQEVTLLGGAGKVEVGGVGSGDVSLPIVLQDVGEMNWQVSNATWSSSSLNAGGSSRFHQEGEVSIHTRQEPSQAGEESTAGVPAPPDLIPVQNQAIANNSSSSSSRWSAGTGKEGPSQQQGKGWRNGGSASESAVKSEARTGVTGRSEVVIRMANTIRSEDIVRSKGPVRSNVVTIGPESADNTETTEGRQGKLATSPLCVPPPPPLPPLSPPLSPPPLPPPPEEFVKKVRSKKTPPPVAPKPKNRAKTSMSKTSSLPKEVRTKEASPQSVSPKEVRTATPAPAPPPPPPTPISSVSPKDITSKASKEVCRTKSSSPPVVSAKGTRTKSSPPPPVAPKKARGKTPSPSVSPKETRTGKVPSPIPSKPPPPAVSPKVLRSAKGMPQDSPKTTKKVPPPPVAPSVALKVTQVGPKDAQVPLKVTQVATKVTPNVAQVAPNVAQVAPNVAQVAPKDTAHTKHQDSDTIAILSSPNHNFLPPPMLEFDTPPGGRGNVAQVEDILPPPPEFAFPTDFGTLGDVEDDKPTITSSSLDDILSSISSSTLIADGEDSAESRMVMDTESYHENDDLSSTSSSPGSSGCRNKHSWSVIHHSKVKGGGSGVGGNWSTNTATDSFQSRTVSWEYPSGGQPALRGGESRRSYDSVATGDKHMREKVSPSSMALRRVLSLHDPPPPVPAHMTKVNSAPPVPAHMAKVESAPPPPVPAHKAKLSASLSNEERQMLALLYPAGRKPTMMKPVVHDTEKHILEMLTEIDSETRNKRVNPPSYGTCGKCAKAINRRQELVQYNDLCYHFMCYQCTTCRVPLQGLRVYKIKASLFCKDCSKKYEDKSSPVIPGSNHRTHHVATFTPQHSHGTTAPAAGKVTSV